MTVGIVLVSHSPILAQGLAELLAQIGSEDVPLAVAGGASDGRLGTSVDLVEEAIVRADLGDGVVIIPDLGSAVLTVRTVLEGGNDHGAVLVDAPFVEGAVAAAVTAASGGTRDEVAEAARQARDVAKF
ncbi:MAG: dihydroxyacetone kinase phosphoryl donor subunit DhaM [Actinomycetota bacterium]|nr:dihydroxyacetone kinase phosphoryl donor subunit DhaM [Actinomycetota bacterium]